jgi:hypothetical protein
MAVSFITGRPYGKRRILWKSITLTLRDPKDMLMYPESSYATLLSRNSVSYQNNPINPAAVNLGSCWRRIMTGGTEYRS